MTQNNTRHPIKTHTPEPLLLSAALHYAAASARYQRSRTTTQPNHLARARYLEVTTRFDTLLTTLILRDNLTLTTGTRAALIKAAAHHLADHLAGTHPEATTDSHQDAHKQLTHLIHWTLAQSETENAHDRATDQALVA
ncbi:hypothetical protein ACT3TB_16365 [Micrococcaceae sp. AOP34-BR2-30]